MATITNRRTRHLRMTPEGHQRVRSGQRVTVRKDDGTEDSGRVCATHLADTEALVSFDSGSLAWVSTHRSSMLVA